jgi:hypothetical protein
MAIRTRRTTTDELLAGFASSLKTLSFNCEQFRRQIEEIVSERSAAPGDPPLTAPVYDHGPIGEIAARLRKLLIRTHGDDLFQRVCTATGTVVPTMNLSGDATFLKIPWNKILVEQFSTGALPVDDESGHPVPVTDVGVRICLAVTEPGEQPATLTWGDLVKQVGDKDGVHLDDDRPVVWDFVNQFHIGEVPAIPLLLYRLAVAVVEAGNVVLQAVGLDPVPIGPPHPAAAMASALMSTETRTRPGPRPGRNDRCPCGSGKKFKRCCGP